MSLPHIIRPAAEAEMQETYTWYEGRQAGLGVRFLAAVRTRVNDICANPQGYGLVARGVRGVKLVRFPQVVYYRLYPQLVVVIAVQHGRRHRRRWRRRR